MKAQQRIVLGVGGGIAAYKVAGLLRLFTESGHRVDVVPTEASLRFVGKATWEALSGRPVRTSVFEAVEDVNHVLLGQDADLIVIAPATADLLARLAAGMANDLLTNTVLASTAPIVVAPAMHTGMWENPATTTNVATLRSRGITVIDPAVGRLTGKDTGAGRLPEASQIFDVAQRFLIPSGATGPRTPMEEPTTGEGPLAGRTVVVTAGGTREPLDPVRFLGNRSSGRQGTAIARAALAAGATVRLVAAHLETEVPAGVELTTASTALELRDAVAEACQGADAVIMAAAVADFRPADYAGTKIKKTGEDGAPGLTLVRNPDILASLVEHRRDHPEEGPALIVGFAAETGDTENSVLEYGHAKLVRKGCDLLVVNEVSATLGFGTEDNTVTILASDGAEPTRIDGSKDEVARGLIATVGTLLNR
ncbi:MAG: bifunctional phosphopantothenoylcysteine decarboxylase/phosphopantothenate--cysteine ligase CoaBC [Arthrobacter sp.]|nr:bifunctional phosphopantothenoylcysteine decarboxylase/phosphopantothenate--cysteine ligase CoaBC [Micrococcaceae bacterium]MDN5879785.1 bifunctional phosphopantothenoylcysteine decarboxylase/phosphopantothenate--cysteine ligase CoaBC [Micrococcaceae bacterium]MDN5887412.1 bifunctional phosphopantothenoylcysteine decarboxylase/phosphopantothenate--cysteine ligase CoaBC [Micrococcaceae bacterium]MDN5905201.1 bifunctional phosphopantothenoylcysteine decarboxylase/phosphopantothenate--cysteine l